MKKNGLVETSQRLRLGLAAALLLGATAVACDPEEEALDSGVSQVGTPGGGSFAGTGGTTGGVGGTTGGGTTGGGTTGGGIIPVTPGGGTTGAPSTAGGTAGGGATAGGASSQWCQVKSVLAKNCGSCHGTTLAGGAPFPLVTHADLTAAHPTKAGQKVYQRVGVRVHASQSQAEGLGVMPPGKEMAAADLALIDAWVAAQAPAGADPTCAGSGGANPPQQNVEWPPKECDGVYKLTARGTSGGPAMAPPGVESHPQVTFDAPWGNEEVQAIAFKTITDNAKVLHHWILYANGLEFITGWAPGEDGVRLMKPDVGMLLPGGPGTLRLDMHYYNTMGTKAEPDQSGVEICVVKRANFRKNTAAVTMGLSNLFFSIPAGSNNYEVKSSCTVSGTQPITLLTASPHAHKYARRMIFTVTKANGQTIKMHDMPFQFGEQKSFPLDPPVVVEAGDVINTTCVFSNDSGRPVTFGESTEDEMCFNFATYYPAGALGCGIGGIDFGSLGGLLGGGGATGGGGFFGGP